MLIFARLLAALFGTQTESPRLSAPSRRGCWPYGMVLMLPQVIAPMDLYHSRSAAVVTSLPSNQGGRITTSYVLPVLGSPLTTRSAVYWVHQPLPSASPAVPYTKFRVNETLSRCIHVFVSGSKRFAPPSVAPQIFP